MQKYFNLKIMWRGFVNCNWTLRNLKTAQNFSLSVSFSKISKFENKKSEVLLEKELLK